MNRLKIYYNHPSAYIILTYIVLHLHRLAPNPIY